MDVHLWILGAGPARSAHAGDNQVMSKHEIAEAAARLVVEEGLDYGSAKRRALKLLGLPARSALPGQDELEDAVRDYISLFCADTQPAELRALRRCAVYWMERLASHQPYLSGAVWRGTATRLSDIYIQLFCEDEKSAELALLNLGLDYQARTVHGFNGEPVEALSLHYFCAELGETIGVHFLVHDRDDLRGALLPDGRKRAPRGDLAAVRRLLEEDENDR